jgi:hypothetical protein
MNRYPTLLFQGHHAEMEIQDLQKKVTSDMQNFERISTRLMQELQVFEQNRMKEFKNNINAYINQMLEKQEKVLEIWEVYLLGAKNIALNT